MILNYVERKDFIVVKEYTVKAVFDSPRGKWPSAIAESIFIDSKTALKTWVGLFFEATKQYSISDSFNRKKSMRRNTT